MIYIYKTYLKAIIKKLGKLNQIFHKKHNNHLKYTHNSLWNFDHY